MGRRVQTSAVGCARQSGAVGCARQSGAERLGGAAEAAELCGAAELLGVPLTGLFSMMITTDYHDF